MSPKTDFLYPSPSELSNNSMMQSSTDAEAGVDDDVSSTSPSSAMDWPLAKTPRFSSSTWTSKEKENNSRDTTKLKDVFSCAKPAARCSSSPQPESAYGAIADNLQIKNNVEVFLDGLVNGFWQCPGGGGGERLTGDASVRSNISRTSAASCKQVMDSLTQSTQQMEFQFVPLSMRKEQQPQQQSHHEMPPIPSTSSSSNTHKTTHQHRSSSSSSQVPPQPKRATGKMFKRIRVKRGERIGLELFEHSKSVYISRVAKEGTGLKRGMRIIAINDHPCPDSVGEAIELLATRLDDDGGYVTFVTGEEHDFEQAASVVGEPNNSTNGGDGESVSDAHSIRSSMGYV